MTSLTDDDVRNGYRKHSMLAQLFRWWQFYERPESTLANQLDILSENVHIDSSGNAVHSRADYQAYAESLPQMRNAHWPDMSSLSLDVADAGVTASLDAQYLNIGALPDGALMNAGVHYDVELTHVEGSVLPVFTTIKIAAGVGDGSTDFVDAYPHSRVSSLVHYYLALLGAPDGQIESFTELFADEITLDFAGAHITTVDGFGEWIDDYTSKTEAAMLTIESMVVADNGDGTFTATVDFEWDGLMHDGSRMEMGTRHVWNVIDGPVERFARIRSIDITRTREMTQRHA